MSYPKRFLRIEEMEAKARDDEFSTAERLIGDDTLKVERAFDGRMNSYYTYTWKGVQIVRAVAIDRLARAIRAEGKVRVKC